MRDKLYELLVNTGDMALRRRALWILGMLKFKANEKILDAGCGDGYYLYLISKLHRGVKLFGIDCDVNALKSAHQNLRGQKVRLIEGNICKMELKESYFDIVLVSEVIEHVEDDRKALEEVHRVLKPGGYILVSVPNVSYPFFWDPINWLLEKLFNTHIKRGFWAGIWNQHKRLYSKTQLESLIKQAGFDNVRVEKLTHYCLPFNHYLINIVARFLARNVVSNKLKDSLSKFSVEGEKSSRKINIFWPLLTIDKLNDSWNGKGSFVSLVAYAKKN